MKRHTCQYCKTEFVSSASDSIFCSHECQNLSRIRLPFKRLQELIDRGLTRAQMAVEVGCSRDTVDKSFARYGLGTRVPRVNVEKLRQLAPQGLRQYEFARRAGISPQSMPAALRRHGLYRTWQQARYQKCQTAGSKLARTASAGAITPSAKSEAPTAGGMNCGI